MAEGDKLLEGLSKLTCPRVLDVTPGERGKIRNRSNLLKSCFGSRDEARLRRSLAVADTRSGPALARAWPKRVVVPRAKRKPKVASCPACWVAFDQLLGTLGLQ